MTWLDALPKAVAALQDRWSLKLGAPFEQEMSCAWVAPATRRDGTQVILKLGMPHLEGLHEIQGLRFWDGDPTVHLIGADEAADQAVDQVCTAMLLEHCNPGTPLRHRPELEQDDVIAGLLRRLWRDGLAPQPFRPLADMTAAWADEALTKRNQWRDAGLVQAGLSLFRELPRTAARHVLLATDLHAGNVLRAEREPWLVIDPKPFVGDPAYDATQHLLNCEARLRTDPRGLIRRFADLLALDEARIRLWLFARLAVASHENMDAELLARQLA